MMNVTLISLLLCSILLSGCAAQNQPATTAPIPPVRESTQAVTDVLSMEMEMEDGAAVSYRLSQSVSGFLPANRGLLFFSGTDNTTLTLMDPQTGSPIAVYETGVPLTPENLTVQQLAEGLSWFDSIAMKTVVLDESLHLQRTIPAPEGLSGMPLLSRDGDLLFYCTADAVRVLDLSTGISRILKEAAYPVQGLSGLLLDDAVLQVSITDTDGSWRTLFLSSETGQLLREAEGNLLPQTTGSSYFLPLPEGPLFGSATASPMLLQPRFPEGSCFFLGKTSSAVTAALLEGNTILDLYDLTAGCRRASLTLPGTHTVHHLQQAADGLVWFMAVQEETGQQFLCRWDSAASSLLDSTYYLLPYHTRQEPDYDGLAACTLRAREIGEKYGMEVLVYRDAVQKEPWDYRLEPEYQVGVLNRELDSLDKNLSRFPAGFLSALAGKYTGLKICLVRSAKGIQTENTPEAVSGIQFLEDYDAYIVLCCGEDTEKALYHELCHLMETAVLTQSTAYDRWDMLNPEGFQYGRTPDREWLQPGREWFIDGYAMTAAKEDRARLFEYAMTTGNDALFRSPPLQLKLQQLCTGIREAFRLEDHAEALPWEQYLLGE